MRLVYSALLALQRVSITAEQRLEPIQATLQLPTLNVGSVHRTAASFKSIVRINELQINQNLFLMLIHVKSIEERLALIFWISANHCRHCAPKS